MRTQRINEQEVQTIVITPAGTESAESLTPQEVRVVEELDKALRGSLEFQRAYPGAKLIRVDSMRALSDHQPGRYYLRYENQETTTEFWGYLSQHPRLDFQQGLVGISHPTDAPA